MISIFPSLLSKDVQESNPPASLKQQKMHRCDVLAHCELGTMISGPPKKDKKDVEHLKI